MASESSFDIVSKVDKQEVSNALHQAQKEISQRYDFRGVGAEIDYSGDKILIKANAEERALAVLDVFQSKLVKRGRLPERPKGADCKSAGTAYGGSNPSPATNSPVTKVTGLLCI